MKTPAALNIFGIGIVFLALLITAPGTQAQTGDIQPVHDPRIIKEANWYYLFSTGGGIQIRRSSDLFVWTHIGTVFRAVPDWARKAVPGGDGLWAPDIAYFNGSFHLYYAVSTFGSNNSRIGVATSKTLDPSSKDYQWVDHGPVVSSVGGRSNWNAIDPGIVTDEQGRHWMSFGSFWSGVKLCRLSETGTNMAPGEDLRPIAGRHGEPIEAPYIARNAGYYYLFVSFDHCCKGVHSNYKIMVGRSKLVTGPYLDRRGKQMTDGGGTLVLASYGRVRGPGHNQVLLDGGQHWLVHHFYDADADGVATLQIRPLLWGDDGWPLAGEPGPYQKSSTDVSVVGRWKHYVNDNKGDVITLINNGHINRPDGPATWSLNGLKLQLRWPRSDAPGGTWVDACLVARDGQWFVGRNQAGMSIRCLRD